MQQPTTTRRPPSRSKPVRLPVKVQACASAYITLRCEVGAVSISLMHPLRDALLLAEDLTTLATQVETNPEPAHDFQYPFRECGLGHLHAQRPVVIGGREFIAARVHCGFYLHTSSWNTPGAHSSASIDLPLSVAQARQFATELRAAVAMTWANAYAEAASAEAIDADHGDAQ